MLDSPGSMLNQYIFFFAISNYNLFILLENELKNAHHIKVATLPLSSSRISSYESFDMTYFTARMAHTVQARLAERLYRMVQRVCNASFK